MTTPAFTVGQLLAADPEATALSIGLGANTLTAGEIDMSDIVEPAYPGYGRQCAGAWEDAEIADEDQVSRRTKRLTFRSTGAAPGVNVRYAFVCAWDGTQNRLLLVEKFDTPRTMDGAGKNIVLQLLLEAWAAAALPTP